MSKTLALSMIVKNEIKHIERILQNVSGLFDAIYITDTGSTDGTLEFIKGHAERIAGCKVNLSHFEWCDDFSKARNHNLDKITEDFWMWLDADDEIKDKDAFIAWKKYAMEHFAVWYASYNYALDENKNPIISFVRERVFLTKTKLRFQDFIHEGVKTAGIIPVEAMSPVRTWSVNHLRTEEDAKKDKSRNISILKKNKDNLSNRLKFYYGKEFFDEGNHQEAVGPLMDVVCSDDMEIHDRKLAYQYLMHSLNIIGKPFESIKFGHLALQLDPNRAEYSCLIGDSYLLLNQPFKALPYYFSAKSMGCEPSTEMSPTFAFKQCYNEYPRTKIAQIYYHQGRFEDALKEVDGVGGIEADLLRKECEKAISKTTIPTENIIETEDIVITCPPGGAYEWDENIYKKKGIGGSETAAVEMAVWLKKITGRCVKIFMPFKKETLVGESGVEYIPVEHVHDYFQKYSPKLHIAWRHTFRLTNAKSIVWSHDLITPGAENVANYDKILCLSEWHANYLNALQGVPKDKIIITRNGINPEKFLNLKDVEKVSGKVIWPNSPDRGLEIALEVMDLVKKEIPEAELHCFYGFDNMRKFGSAQKADFIEAQIKMRDYVKFHGNVDQWTLIKEMASSEVWLYTANFLETFCITGIEAILCQTWPVIRPVAALQNTLSLPMNMAPSYGDYVNMDLDNKHLIRTLADRVIDAIKNKKYNRAKFDPNFYSWESVAKEWIKIFDL